MYSIGVASDTFCPTPTKVGQAMGATFKLVEDSTRLDEDVISFPTSITHIEFVIPDKFNDVNYVMESNAALFSILPTVVPDLKQVLCVRILLLQHYKTQGQVYSSQGSMMQEHDIYFIFILFNFGVDCMFILGLSI